MEKDSDGFAVIRELLCSAQTKQKTKKLKTVGQRGRGERERRREGALDHPSFHLVAAAAMAAGIIVSFGRNASRGSRARPPAVRLFI